MNGDATDDKPIFYPGLRPNNDIWHSFPKLFMVMMIDVCQVQNGDQQGMIEYR